MQKFQNEMVLASRYHLVNCLASNPFSSVWSVRDAAESNTLRALKIFHSEKALPSSIIQFLLLELSQSHSWQHPGLLLPLRIDIFENHPLLLLPFADGGSVHDLVKKAPIPGTIILHLLEQILSCLTYLHSYKMVHQDLKPDNILLTTRGGCFISDFGLSRIIHGLCGHISHPQGIFHQEYAPPERSHDKHVEPSHDIFALGIILHEMMTGMRPKTNEAGEYMPEASNVRIAGHYSDFLVRSMTNCLQRNPLDRPSAANLLTQVSKARQDIGQPPVDSAQSGELEVTTKITAAVSTGSKQPTADAVSQPRTDPSERRAETTDVPPQRESLPPNEPVPEPASTTPIPAPTNEKKNQDQTPQAGVSPAEFNPSVTTREAEAKPEKLTQEPAVHPSADKHEKTGGNQHPEKAVHQKPPAAVKRTRSASPPDGMKNMEEAIRRRVEIEVRKGADEARKLAEEAARLRFEDERKRMMQELGTLRAEREEQSKLIVENGKLRMEIASLQQALSASKRHAELFSETADAERNRLLSACNTLRSELESLKQEYDRTTAEIEARITTERNIREEDQKKRVEAERAKEEAENRAAQFLSGHQMLEQSIQRLQDDLATERKLRQSALEGLRLSEKERTNHEVLIADLQQEIRHVRMEMDIRTHLEVSKNSSEESARRAEELQVLIDQESVRVEKIRSRLTQDKEAAQFIEATQRQENSGTPSSRRLALDIIANAFLRKDKEPKARNVAGVEDHSSNELALLEEKLDMFRREKRKCEENLHRQNEEGTRLKQELEDLLSDSQICTPC